MVDDKWVFPELATEIVSLHKEFFSKTEPTGTPLSIRELNRFGDGIYPKGWRFQLKTTLFQAVLLLDRFIPFSAPRVALTTDEYFLKWPHIEENGLLCLRDDTDSINHFAGLSLTEYYIERANDLVLQNMKGEINQDLSTEFNSYWNRWCERKGIPLKRIFLLSPMTNKSRKIFVLNFTHSIVVCESIETGIHWSKLFFRSKTINEQDFHAGAFIWLPEPLIPDKYPKTNFSASAITKSAGEEAYSILSEMVPDKAGSTIMVFGFESGNGTAYGAIQLNEPKHQLRPGKKINSRSKGFRNKKKFAGTAAQRYFTTEGKIDTYPVQRVDRRWIFERGSIGLNSDVDIARIGIIGCGSLGSHVTRLLVESGVRKLVLIDPDNLSWDNIARHLLGASHTGNKKVTAIKDYFDSQYPGQLEIQIKAKQWQTVFSEEMDTILNCDLLVSTIGDWDSESALNYTFNTKSDFPTTVYGWTEPYGFVGHALAIFGLGGCLACGMNGRGAFRYAVTQWESTDYRKRPPACGTTYQPYGALDISTTQSMIAKLSIDALTKKVTHSQHRIWVGDISTLKSAGGRLSNEWSDRLQSKSHENRIYFEDWKRNKDCIFNH